MKNSVCPICGQPTSSYMGHERKDGLCRKHAGELKEGKIELRPYNGAFLLYDLFYDTKTNLILNKDKNDIPEELRGQWLYGKINSATLWDDVEENAPEISPAVTEKDEQKSNIYPTIDGHMVKSSMEQAIDDILWNAGILHAYEQPITEFVYERKKCDWFIPIIGSEQGIYIEYWGMKTQKYLEDRKEKEDLYKQYNVPYIGIEKDDPKDTHSFRSMLLQELQRKAIEYYGFMPKWKK